jgi:hypothetical protein
MALIIALGDPVIINVLVLSSGILLTPTGTVILQDKNHTISVGRLGNNGQFTFNISSIVLGLGVHEMTAYYAGDQNFAPGFSNVLEVDIVNLAQSTTTIMPSATSIAYGTLITFSSTVTGTGGTPTGMVTFLDGVNVIDTETLVGGSAMSVPVVLSGGTHAVIAEYSGDNIFGGGFSFPALITVSEFSSSIAVFSNANPSNYGGSITFSAAITVPAGGVATGTITFYDGATVIGTSGVSVNSGSLMVSTLTAGNHNITAQYSGDSNFSLSTSPILVQVVNQLPSMTTLITSANPVTWGTAVLLSATVSSAFTIPTGTVTFYDGVTAIGSAVTINGSGLATLNVPLFSVPLSPHSLTAKYSGDTNYLISTSNAISEVINKQNTTTTLMSSAPTSPASVSITFTATVVGVNNGPITGTVQFYNGGSPMGSPATVNGSGVATYSTSSLTTGVYNITAIYGGDPNNNPSPTSNTVVETITAEASSTFLISNMPTVNYGTSGVIFTATVSGSLGTPTGTVQFQDNGVNLGSVQGLVGGIATFSLSPTQLLPGTHPITAVYSGDSTYAPDTSNTVFQVINRLTPTFTISSSANPSIYGNSVIFFGTAVGTQGTPTGTVQFVIDGTNFGAPITLVAGSAQTSTSALLATPTLSPAYHTISANYNGDMIYNSASISLSPNQTVSKANVSVSINSSIPTTAINQSTTFSSTVTSVTTGTPTGTVQFKNGGVNINGAISLISGTGSLAYSGLTIGAHTITSTYSGDANFNGNTSINFTQTVTASPTTTTLLSNLPTSTYGQAVIFTATVNGSSPTGTLTFKNGGVTFATTTLPTNTTSYALLTAGSHSITVVYSGDGNNGPSTSNTVTQTVNKASTTINPFTASPSSGETVFSTFSLSATVNPQYVVSPGPSGSITFTIVSPFTSLGSGVISANVATLGSLNIPTAGTYQLQANYVGDSNFNGSSQFIGGFVVSKLTPSISQNFTNSTTAGNPSTTDYVDLIGDGSHNVTGTVTLLIDGVTTALTGNLIHRGGIDTSYPGIAISGTNFGGTEQQGYHTVQASYGGSSSYNAVTSTVTSYFYQCATPTITITITGSPSDYNNPPPGGDITITITVSGSFALPTGTVSLNVIGETTGHAFNTGQLTLSGGTATVLISNVFAMPNGPTPGYSPISTGIYDDLVGSPTNGTQTYSTSTLYSGDNTYNPSGNTGPTFEIYGGGE